MEITMANHRKHLELVKIQLSQRADIPVSRRVMRGVVAKGKERLEMMKIILQHNKEISIYEDIVKVAVEKSYHGLEMIELLLNHKSGIAISEEIVKAAAGNDATGPEILEMLLKYFGNIPINEEVLEAAAENQYRGSEVMGLLLKHMNNLVVSEEVMKKAAGNSGSGPEIMEMLLKYCGNFPVSEEVLKAAAKNYRGLEIMEILLNQKSGIAISGEVVKAAAGNGHKGIEIVDKLLKHSGNIPISEELMKEVVAKNRYHGLEMMENLLNYTRDLAISKEATKANTGSELHGPEVLEVLPEFKGNITNCDYTIQATAGWKREDREVAERQNAIPQNHQPSCEICNDLRISPGSLGTIATFCFEDLGRAARAGCQTCSLLQRCISKHTGQITPEDSISLSSDSETSPLKVSVKPKEKLFDRTRDQFEIYSQLGCPVLSPRIGPARSISADSSSEECMALAIGWIEECTSYHHKCPLFPSPLPTRVIQVGSEDVEPSLYISSSESAKYVALSHRWGGSKPIETTVSTLDDRKRAIPFTKLPKSYQDAIIITRRLGINYLWIDSLCIIQDSAEDWSQESANMIKVYANSFVTIAADRADDSSGGCFGSASERNMSFAVSGYNSDGVKGRVYVRSIAYRSEYIGHVAHTMNPPDVITTPEVSEWNSRAWTFQERLLAPRVLHYSISELAWECMTQLCCECQAFPTVFENPLGDNDKASENYRGSFLGSHHLLSMSTRDAQVAKVSRSRLWANIVGEFTSRTLSRQTDRLPALSGLAGLFKLELGDEYLCGIWRRDLAVGLLWRVMDEHYDDGPYPSRRHENYYAPSWSWAAVTGPVILPSVAAYETDIEVLDAKCSPASSNPYGPALSGFIKVRGLLVPLQAKNKSKHPYSLGSYLGVQFPSDIGPGKPSVYLGDVYLDVSSEDYEDREVKEGDPLFLLVVTQSVSSIGIQGLALRAVDGDCNTFQRVGYINNIENVALALWCEIAERRNITII